MYEYSGLWYGRVASGEMTQKDLDTMIQRQQKEIEELKHMRQLDMAEIINLRRQVERLTEDK